MLIALLQIEHGGMAVDPLNFEDLLSDRENGERWRGLPENTIMGLIHLHVAGIKKLKNSNEGFRL